MNFSVKYDGQALKNHQMAVDKLTTALFAIDSLIKEANLLLNGDRFQSDLKTENITTKILLIQQLSFKKGIKWKFLDGSNQISANILDESFVDKINNGEVKQ